MKMTFEVIIDIDIDEATPDELEEAISDALRVLDMPNDDRLYIDPRVTSKVTNSVRTATNTDRITP